MQFRGISFPHHTIGRSAPQPVPEYPDRGYPSAFVAEGTAGPRTFAALADGATECGVGEALMEDGPTNLDTIGFAWRLGRDPPRVA
jgi:hypothetical protein